MKTCCAEKSCAEQSLTREIGLNLLYFYLAWDSYRVLIGVSRMEIVAMRVAKSWRQNHQDDDGPPKKKWKGNEKVVNMDQKNPLMVLNEKKLNVVYDITYDGPSHARIFFASATINGQTYSAQGTTKKKAKANVAQIILQCSDQLKDPAIRAHLSDQLTSRELDFSQDMPEIIVCSSDDFYSFDSVGADKVKSLPMPISKSPESPQSNPVFCLNKIKPGIKIDIVKEEGTPHSPIFTARVVLDNENFEGVGSSKKQARNKAAQAALQMASGLERINPPEPPSVSTQPLNSPEPPSISTQPFKPPEIEFGDYIASLVENTYLDVMKNEEPSLSRYKVLAGVVMTRGPTADQSTVICVTTGSKCISGGQLSMEGETLNDCHAEVLARRGLVSYLYDQLNTYNTDPLESIFECIDNDSILKLRNDVCFHLYVSSAPCGDARIFTLNDSLSSPLEDLHPNRRGRGVLRTKIECGEGTIPVTESAIQTWDGILQGERLRTMSCSDKLARWNIVGVQGSLLSHLINPIYFHTIVVGSLFHQVHLGRALIGRIENFQGSSPFILSRPVLCTISKPPDRLPSKSPKHSVIWIHGWPEHEVVDISKGKLINGSSSRLSKRYFFHRFTTLASLNPDRRNLIIEHLKDGHVTYTSLKRAAGAFVKAKEMLRFSFVTARLGHWIKKPLEHDSFEIPFDLGQAMNEDLGSSLDPESSLEISLTAT